MSDQAQAPQEQAVQQVQVVQPVDVKTLPVEERVRRAMFPEKVAAEEKPRGPDGKFLPTKQEEAKPQEEAAAEVPAEPDAQGEEQTPEEIADEEWETLKNRKTRAKVDGEELPVTLEEARLGYMRQSDYQRKTQEVSKQRADAQEQARQAIETAQRQYAETLQLMEQGIVRAYLPELQSADLQKLKTENPQEYIRVSERAEYMKHALHQIRQEQETLKREQEKTLQEKRTQAKEQALLRVKELIPGWGEELQKSLFNAGIEHYGFSPEEMSSVIDPRVVRVIHDATQYQKMKTQKPLAEKRVAEAPRVLKPGAKPNPVDQARNAESQIRERLHKSGGKDMDAIAALVQRKLRK